MAAKIYDIIFKRLVRWLTPEDLRTGSLLAFIESFIVPVVWLYQSFLKYRKAKIYELTITPQVCYLEMLLNDRFDFSQRRIYITDAVWHQSWYIYQENELKPEFLFVENELHPIYLYTDNEAGEVKDDFVVVVPNGLLFDENEMRSLLDGFRLAGKRYKVSIA